MFFAVFFWTAGYAAHHCPLWFLMALLLFVHIGKLYRYTEKTVQSTARGVKFLPAGTTNPPVFHIKLSQTFRLTAANSTRETSFNFF